MTLDLSDDDARTLRALLHDYLPALRMEVARTDAKDFRHEMVKRQELCEKLLERLTPPSDRETELRPTL